MVYCGMTCCEDPRVRQGKGNETASCTTCGFRWVFDLQGKGKYKTKQKQWGPVWFSADDYDRGWRLRDYDRHEVIGTRRRGKVEYWVVACPKSGRTVSVSTDDVGRQVYCHYCDRSGEFSPMLKRHQERKGQ